MAGLGRGETTRSERIEAWFRHVLQTNGTLAPPRAEGHWGNAAGKWLRDGERTLQPSVQRAKRGRLDDPYSECRRRRANGRGSKVAN